VKIASHIISTILRHDAKVASYKIALLRAINDVVLAYPDLRTYHSDVAVPLRALAEYWVAYYWPFADPAEPIMQGPRSRRAGVLRNDVSFRPQLTQLRQEWETLSGSAKPADGFWLINEFRVPRKQAAYPPALLKLYVRAVSSISKAIEMPIRHAGHGEWTVFDKPVLYEHLNGVVSIPGTLKGDACLLIRNGLWETFREMSLYVEALCIHEWCLFTEKVEQEDGIGCDRGVIYRLLTDRPDNRRPLTWERNNIDLLLMEGKEFICPWTTRRINKRVAYDLDHLVPVTVYPTNELWNLVPADPYFNSHVKRNRLPSFERLIKAEPHLALAYSHYESSKSLSRAIREDTIIRFSTLQHEDNGFPYAVAKAVVDFITQLAASRNLARFE
jgi:HNH endonuclease